MTDLSHARLRQVIKDLLSTHTHADLTIRCLDDEYQAQKEIVLSRSVQLAGLCKGGADEDGEPYTVLDLGPERGDAVKQVINYCYYAYYEPFELPIFKELYNEAGTLLTSQYAFPHTCAGGLTCDAPNQCHHRVCDGKQFDYTCADCAHEIAPSDSYQAFTATQLATHMKMFFMGMRYGVDGLQELATAKFARACERFWTSVEFEDVAEKIVKTHDESAKELRRVVVVTVAAHTVLLGRAKIREMLENERGFALEVLLRGGT